MRFGEDRTVDNIAAITFQYYNSEIWRIKNAGNSGLNGAFQYYNSEIWSQEKELLTHLINCFNTTIVRFGDFITCCIIYPIIWFQYYNSEIWS